MQSGFEMYNILIWLFVVVITVLMLCLCFLNIAVRRAQKQESESVAFSQMMIEGQEKERYRISRELHDVVLPLVKDASVSESIRSICRKLIPQGFDHLSLGDSILDVCAHFSMQSGIECVCAIDKNLDFSPLTSEKRLHVYRIIQEALNNIEKHSGATKAIVTARYADTKNDLSEMGKRIVICISDDGIGLTEKAKPNGILMPGIGMTSMRQRAAILGADLDFQSESGQGLMVRIKIDI